MARNIDDVKLEIQEKINELIGAENRLYQDQFDLLERNNSSIDSFEQLLRDVKRTVQAINGDLDYTSDAFSKIVDELKIGNKALQFQETLISRGAKIARETLEIRKGETYASASHVENLQRQLEVEMSLLTSLKNSSQLSDDQKDKIQSQIKELQHVKEELDGILNTNKELNNSMKFGVKSASALDGVFKKLGLPDLGFNDAYEETIKLGQGAKAAGVNFDASATYTKLLGNNLKAAASAAIPLLLLTELYSALKLSDKAVGDLAKSFNITYDQALGVRNELNNIAASSMDAAVNTKGLQESMIAIGTALGSNAMLNEQDLVFMTKMREQAGFANEELVEMQKLTFATGGNLEDNTKNLLFAAKTTALNNGVLLNEKDIMRDVAKASNAVKLSVVGGAEGLGKAAAQAKALGMNLSQLDNIASGLLDFESSINAELEAQLLTGKNINLEQARLYALNNDMAGLSREIAKNIGTAADFGKMNRIQQEAVAKAVGMTREDLATTLTDQEALRGLSGKAAEDAKAALAGARARGMTEEQIREKGIKDLMKQQSVQERLNQSVEKLKDIFVSIAEPILRIVSPLADLISTVLPAINFLLSPLVEGFNLISMGVRMFTDGLKEANPLAITLAATIGIMSVNLIKAAISAIWTALGQIPFGVGLALAATATAGFISLLAKANAQKIGDMYVPPKGKGKTLISTSEGGLYEPSSNDAIMVKPPDKNSSSIDNTVIKNTNLDKKSSSLDTSKLEASLANFINAINNRPLQINTVAQIDGEIASKKISQYATAMGTTINQFGVKTQ